MPFRRLLFANQKLLCATAFLDRRVAFVLLMVNGLAASRAQSSVPQDSPQHWVQKAAEWEQSIIQNDGSFPLRYRIRKVDAKGDTTREVIESRDGTVARLVQRNGQPLTASEDRAEQQRLQEVLRSPADFIRRHKRDAATRSYAAGLVKLLPAAMRFSYAPGQPQSPRSPSPQVVIDFSPDPAFKPPNTLSQLLAGVAGRFWIDQRTGRMIRAEARVLHPVDFGFGLLVRIHEGGTIEFEQAEVGVGRWAYSHLEEHLVLRELLLKTAPEDSVMSSYDFQLLPAPLSFQDAVHSLLAMQIPIR